MASEWARNEVNRIQAKTYTWGSLTEAMAESLDAARAEGAKCDHPVSPVPCPTCGTACHGPTRALPVYNPIAPPVDEYGIKQYLLGQRTGREAGLLEGRREGERAAFNRVYLEVDKCGQGPDNCQLKWINIPHDLWREIEQAARS